MTLLREAIAELVESTLANIMHRKTNWMISLTVQVTRLAKAVIEMRDTVQANTYGVDPLDTLVTSVLLPPLRI